MCVCVLCVYRTAAHANIQRAFLFLVHMHFRDGHALPHARIYIDVIKMLAQMSHTVAVVDVAASSHLPREVLPHDMRRRHAQNDDNDEEDD